MASWVVQVSYKRVYPVYSIADIHITYLKAIIIDYVIASII